MWLNRIKNFKKEAYSIYLYRVSQRSCTILVKKKCIDLSFYPSGIILAEKLEIEKLKRFNIVLCLDEHNDKQLQQQNYSVKRVIQRTLILLQKNNKNRSIILNWTSQKFLNEEIIIHKDNTGVFFKQRWCVILGHLVLITNLN